MTVVAMEIEYILKPVNVADDAELGAWCDEVIALPENALYTYTHTHNALKHEHVIKGVGAADLVLPSEVP